MRGVFLTILENAVFKKNLNGWILNRIARLRHYFGRNIPESWAGPSSRRVVLKKAASTLLKLSLGWRAKISLRTVRNDATAVLHTHRKANHLRSPIQSGDLFKAVLLQRLSVSAHRSQQIQPSLCQMLLTHLRWLVIFGWFHLANPR